MRIRRWATVTAAVLLGSVLLAAPIDREALVRRHRVVVRQADAWSPLSVGNGEFAFTADITGLQTFPEHYGKSIPLATQSQWGWHSFPSAQAYQLAETYQAYATGSRAVPYPTMTKSPAGRWLRQNPHRLGLARIGFAFPGAQDAPISLSDVSDIEQVLDLWTGTLDSRFSIRGSRKRVRTWVHPSRDLIALRVEGAPDDAPLAIKIEFPYGAGVHTGDPADWTKPGSHRTIESAHANRIEWRRELDRDRYFARAEWAGKGCWRKLGAHQYLISFTGGSFELVVEFAPKPFSSQLPGVRETEDASRRYWSRFWSEGGAIDLSASKDPRANELERRIVLSQYLTAIQCAGSRPPQETGLTFNSWYGKFHLEMHWWHAAHFALWGRPHLLARSLAWYSSILPRAKETARRQGYAGARWPKMIGPDGRESPSDIGPLLIWQQPHIIYLLELLYRDKPDSRLLRQYQNLVFQTAEFMASFARWDAEKQTYVLGPPLIPAQEIHRPRTTQNAAFELAYWRWGLETAQRWRERLGMRRDGRWDHVAAHLAPLPVMDGLYVNAESDPATFRNPSMRCDHPTLLASMGVLPGAGVDGEIMRRTLKAVMRQWQWDTTWGWDYPMTAMTAARVNEPGLAIDALLMDVVKNRYLPNGHNFQRDGLTIYLPGNGGLLTAVAMMAAGWDGAPGVAAPGFPRDWGVRWEGLRRMP